jgi:mRNA interferase MazF
MNYSKGDVVLLPYPFTDLSTTKVRPAVVVSSNKGKFNDLFVVPISSKMANLCQGEFPLDWQSAGLNVPSVVKRGCVLVDVDLLRKKVGVISSTDLNSLHNSIKLWLEL